MNKLMGKRPAGACGEVYADGRIRPSGCATGNGRGPYNELTRVPARRMMGHPTPRIGTNEWEPAPDRERLTG